MTTNPNNVIAFTRNLRNPEQMDPKVQEHLFFRDEAKDATKFFTTLVDTVDPAITNVLMIARDDDGNFYLVSSFRAGAELVAHLEYLKVRILTQMMGHNADMPEDQ